MATKIYGVGIEDIQKLRDFYFSLMKKKFIRPCDKMEFLSWVGVKSETVVNGQRVRVAVSDGNIHIDDGVFLISKSMISKIYSNELEVKLILKRSYLCLGTFTCFIFNHDSKKQEFLNAIGEIDQYASDDSTINEQTPPSSESSSDENLS